MADEEKPASGAPPSGDAPKAAPKAAAAPAAGGHAPPKPPPAMAAVPWEGPLVENLKQAFAGRISQYATYLGQNFLVAEAGAVDSILDFLKLEADFDYLVDMTAVDYPKNEKRFEIVYILYSFASNERLRVKIQVADGAKPPSVVHVHLGANWLEREIFDMFGIEFEGHPDMRRILLPEEWTGFPLRKEYSILQQDDRWVKENLGIESGH
jgi:NADH-quinone oxidoreductase subunit C